MGIVARGLRCGSWFPGCGPPSGASLNESVNLVVFFAVQMTRHGEKRIRILGVATPWRSLGWLPP